MDFVAETTEAETTHDVHSIILAIFQNFLRFVLFFAQH